MATVQDQENEHRRRFDHSSSGSAKIKEPAETYLGGEVNDAVVTVPTYSMVPSVRPPGRRKYLKTRRAVSLTRLTAAAYIWPGQAGNWEAVYWTTTLGHYLRRVCKPLRMTSLMRAHGPRVFNDRKPNTSSNPDEAVEYSAAVQGTSNRRRVLTV